YVNNGSGEDSRLWEPSVVWNEFTRSRDTSAQNEATLIDIAIYYICGTRRRTTYGSMSSFEAPAMEETSKSKPFHYVRRHLMKQKQHATYEYLQSQLKL
ncbi:hypothetical protein V1478_007309, partial [Vespula squamosa]